MAKNFLNFFKGINLKILEAQSNPKQDTLKDIHAKTHEDETAES